MGIDRKLQNGNQSNPQKNARRQAYLGHGSRWVVWVVGVVRGDTRDRGSEFGPLSLGSFGAASRALGARRGLGLIAFEPINLKCTVV